MVDSYSAEAGICNSCGNELRLNRNFRSLDEFTRFLQKETLEADSKLALALKAVALNTKAHIADVMGDPTKLAPNAESTIARKGFDAPLVDTGEMKASLEVMQSLNESGVGTADEKMYWHEYGLGRNYPERPAMYEGTIEASEENQAIIRAAVADVFGDKTGIDIIVTRLGERTHE